MSTKTDTTARCEMCGNSIDLDSDYAVDPDGIRFCADCTWDEKHQKKSPCAAEFNGAPLRPGRPFRVFYCRRPTGHPGNHVGHLRGAKDSEYASVAWSRTYRAGETPQ